MQSPRQTADIEALLEEYKASEEGRVHREEVSCCTKTERGIAFSTGAGLAGLSFLSFGGALASWYTDQPTPVTGGAAVGAGLSALLSLLMLGIGVSTYIPHWLSFCCQSDEQVQKEKRRQQEWLRDKLTLTERQRAEIHDKTQKKKDELLKRNENNPAHADLMSGYVPPSTHIVPGQPSLTPEQLARAEGLDEALDRQNHEFERRAKGARASR